MLSDRQKLILKAIIEEYVKSAEPVGSKSLTQKPYLNFSPATLRYEMAYLEELGYLEKTHTSSGRVPSEKGYKYYVEHLVTRDVEVADSFPLIDKIFEDNKIGKEKAVKEVLNLLSDLTNYTAVALGPDVMNTKIKKLDLIKISNNEAILLIVTSSGHVQNLKISYGNLSSFDDLQKVVTSLDGVLKDKTFDKVEEILNNKFADKQINELVNLQEKIIDVFLEAFQKFTTESYYFTGLANMFEQPEFRDFDKLKRLVSTMSNKSLMKIMGDFSDSSLSVKIGNENRLTQMKDCTVVSVPYQINEFESGTIAVIGPTRMEYKKVIPLVEYIAKNMSKLYEK